MDPILTSIILGIVEGLTEFVPVSSTGHLILATELLGQNPSQWKVFNVVIQLGAILAVVVQYWSTFWGVLTGLFKWQADAVRFTRNILLAFIPSVVLGLTFKDQIDIMLGEPSIVAWALIAGGIAIIVIEKAVTPGEDEPVADLSVKQCLGVGFAQCLAMIPGVSRSGATIMGAVTMGMGRKTAAEFSFFLAVPTMIGASTLELYDYRDNLMNGTGVVGWPEIALGFGVSFIVALVVIRAFVAYVSRHGFTPFGWYRIVLGTLWLGAAYIGLR